MLELLNKNLPFYHHSEWKERILALRTPPAAPASIKLTPQQVLEVVRRLSPPDAIVATDVGQH